MPNMILVSNTGVNHAMVVPPGFLSVTPAASTLFFDPFDGTVIDIVNRWGSPVLGGTGTVTQANGQLAIGTGTTASNAGALTTIESFSSTATGFIQQGAALQLEAGTIQINTHRFIGQGTPNASYTTATPLADAYGWEIDVDGLLKAVTYAGNVRTIWGQRPAFTDGFPHIYLTAVRSDAVLFFLDNLEEYVFAGGYQGASTSRLPFRLHMINGVTPPAVAPVFRSFAAAVVDSSGTFQSTYNGQALSALRSPGKFITLNAVSVAAETTIWTPAAGRRFRLMGYVLEVGTIGGNVLLKDNTAGATVLIIPFGAANGVIQSPPMGNGILSAAVNNVLTATGVATQTLSGYVFGCEE